MPTGNYGMPCQIMYKIIDIETCSCLHANNGERFAQSELHE